MERFRKLISMTTKFLRALLPIDNQSTQKVKYETWAFSVDFLIYVLWKETLIDLHPIEVRTFVSTSWKWTQSAPVWPKQFLVIFLYFL